MNTDENEEIKKIQKFFDELGIYVHSEVIIARDLYYILNDEEKLRELVSKLKMKAFW